MTIRSLLLLVLVTLIGSAVTLLAAPPGFMSGTYQEILDSADWNPPDRWVAIDFNGEMPEDTVTDDNWWVDFPDPVSTFYNSDTPPALVNVYDDFWGYWVYSDECNRWYYFASNAFFWKINQSTWKVTNLKPADVINWVFDDVMGKWINLNCFPAGFRCNVDPGDC